VVPISAILATVIGQAVVVIGFVLRLTFKAGRVLQTVEDHERRICKLEEPSVL